MKNILEICRDAANIACVQPPDSLFAGGGQNEQIFLSVACDALDGLLRYGDWQELTKDGELCTVAGKKDYFIGDFCPDFFRLLNNTVYIKDAADKLIGAVTPEQWQREKYFHDPDGKIKFKIQNSMFRFLAPPPDKVKIVFQYRSAVVAYDSGLFTEKTKISADSDIPVFDEYLVKLAICWRLQARNGQDYQEIMNEYQQECRKHMAAGLATRDINLAGGFLQDYAAEGGVIVYEKPNN